MGRGSPSNGSSATSTCPGPACPDRRPSRRRCGWTEGGIARSSGGARASRSPRVPRARSCEGVSGSRSREAATCRSSDGRIGFEGTEFRFPASTLEATGGLRIGQWLPNFDFHLKSRDLAEFDRIFQNFQAASGGASSPLGLGGSGEIEGHIAKSWGDPEVTARFSAENARYGGVAFGSVRGAADMHDGAFLFHPLRIYEGSATISLEGTTRYRKDPKRPAFDFVLTAKDYPISRLLEYLDLDYPIQGRLTGSFPIVGSPPDGVSGSGVAALDDAVFWGQSVPRLTGRMALSPGTFELDDVRAEIGGGGLGGRIAIAFKKKTFEARAAGDGVPLESLSALSGFGSDVSGRLSFEVSGSGTFAQPDLTASATLSEAAFFGRPVPGGSLAAARVARDARSRGRDGLGSGPRDPHREGRCRRDADRPRRRSRRPRPRRAARVHAGDPAGRRRRRPRGPRPRHAPLGKGRVALRAVRRDRGPAGREGPEGSRSQRRGLFRVARGAADRARRPSCRRGRRRRAAARFVGSLGRESDPRGQGDGVGRRVGARARRSGPGARRALRRGRRGVGPGFGARHQRDGAAGRRPVPRGRLLVRRHRGDGPAARIFRGDREPAREGRRRRGVRLGRLPAGRSAAPGLSPHGAGPPHRHPRRSGAAPDDRRGPRRHRQRGREPAARRDHAAAGDLLEGRRAHAVGPALAQPAGRRGRGARALEGEDGARRADRLSGRAGGSQQPRPPLGQRGPPRQGHPRRPGSRSGR